MAASPPPLAGLKSFEKVKQWKTVQPLQRDERKQHSSRRVNKNKDGARGTHTWRPQQRIRAEAHCRLPTAWLCLSTHTRLARKPRGAPGSPSQRSGVWKKVCDLLWAPFYIHFYFLWKHQLFSSVQSLSRVRLFATPWIAARQASLSLTNSRSSLRLTSIESVVPSSHLILCRPLLLLPPILPNIRVFSNESTLRMRWPKYWSFSFSIIPSKFDVKCWVSVWCTEEWFSFIYTRRQEKGTTEDEMVGWHHWRDGCEFEQTPGDGDGQGSLACCSPRGHKELDTTEQINNSNCANIIYSFSGSLPF